jgi:hypothetical protein
MAIDVRRQGSDQVLRKEEIISNYSRLDVFTRRKDVSEVVAEEELGRRRSTSAGSQDIFGIAESVVETPSRPKRDEMDDHCSSATKDPNTLKKLAAVASLNFPLNCGKGELPTPADFPSSECFLCHLTVWGALRTKCCRIETCKVCFEYAQSMCDAQMCPLCGHGAPVKLQSPAVKIEPSEEQLFSAIRSSGVLSPGTLSAGSPQCNRDSALLPGLGSGVSLFSPEGAAEEPFDDPVLDMLVDFINDSNVDWASPTKKLRVEN